MNRTHIALTKERKRKPGERWRQGQRYLYSGYIADCRCALLKRFKNATRGVSVYEYPKLTPSQANSHSEKYIKRDMRNHIANKGSLK